jgi:predicted transposase YbfD/YdcC
MDDSTSRVEFKPELEDFFVGEYVFDLRSLYAYLEEVTDLRDPKGVRYQLADVLTLVILAKLGGEDEVRGIADWLRERKEKLVQALGLSRQSMPHQTTISRIMGAGVDEVELGEVLQRYVDGQAQASSEIVIAIDGKTMRGTIPFGQGVHLLAAYLPQEGLVLMQVEVGTKENEITAAPKLLECLDLRDKVVVGDAMHTQRKLSIDIVNAGGDYLWTAKGNQPALQEAIVHLFSEEKRSPGFALTPTDFQSAIKVNKGHGRLERRTLTTSSMLKDYLDWPFLQQVFKLERRIINLTTGELSEQTVYGVTSLAADKANPQQLLHLNRHYWAIEHGLHYRRDVTLNEDRCRLRTGHAAQTMATINNLVLTLIRNQGYSNVPDARRKFAAHPLEALKLIMQQP